MKYFHDVNQTVAYFSVSLPKTLPKMQVLVRFEGFPTKKLEALRMAAVLYSKLNSVVTNLEGWKVVAPLGQQLDKVESYFNKVKL